MCVILKERYVHNNKKIIKNLYNNVLMFFIIEFLSFIYIYICVCVCLF